MYVYICTRRIGNVHNIFIEHRRSIQDLQYNMYVCMYVYMYVCMYERIKVNGYNNYYLYRPFLGGSLARNKSYFLQYWIW